MAIRTTVKINETAAYAYLWSDDNGATWSQCAIVDAGQIRQILLNASLYPDPSFRRRFVQYA